MPSNEELYAAQNAECDRLQLAWFELFVTGDEADQRAAVTVDLTHPKPSLAALIDHLLEEGDEHVQKYIQEEVAKPDADSDEIAQRASHMMTNWARMVAIRTYKLGQYLRDRMPYDKLTDCTCMVLTDDDTKRLMGHP